jgi:hypothetical protein
VSWQKVTWQTAPTVGYVVASNGGGIVRLVDNKVGPFVDALKKVITRYFTDRLIEIGTFSPSRVNSTVPRFARELMPTVDSCF